MSYVTRVAVCPDHSCDLEDLGLGMYRCPEDDEYLPWTYVVHPDDIDDDTDRGTDDGIR